MRRILLIIFIGLSNTILAQGEVDDLVQQAVLANKHKDYALAAEKLNKAYEKSGNLDYLYFSSASSIGNSDYNIALKALLKLYSLNYTGISKENKVSRYPEVIQSIAMLYMLKKEYPKSLKFIKKAIRLEPKNIEVLFRLGEIQLAQGKKYEYMDTMRKVLSIKPEQATANFNLGVIVGKLGNIEMAKKYYRKTIAIDKTYESAYVNLFAAILSGESKIVKEMNNLGSTAEDDKRYEYLKEKRKKLYRKAVMCIEELLKVNPNHIEALRTAKNIYAELGENKKFNAVKSKLKSLNQN